MSSLKRMFEQFVRERQNRRIERALLEEHKEAAVRLFDTNLDALRKPFASTPATLQSTPLPSYPGAMWMGHIGINAFSVTQDIEVEQFPVYFNLVAAGRERVGQHQFVSDGSTHTFFGSADRCSGKKVNLLTNDIELVRSVSVSEFNPPPPWLAWYELGSLIYNLQGDAQSWYENVWDRYWESLSLAEQDAFIEVQRTSANAYLTEEEWGEWLAAIRTRDARYLERLKMEYEKERR
ncbi:hypothetical protein WT19_17850 [Burkholderia stagnalis]|uniref:Uncharacterized protein n=1 Tax=Burkholderia stagnalis TaxID=1503054 RepID=A0A6L3N3X1_9BURK|nr:hypothetical protein [Burkholderia stagnalis]KAB0641025.1 hypothetical protein F7R25_03340 [Burkholderia stagnalis]KVO71605.1 hypothetical protein WT19_17850 [Burkholderia stagnalis]KWH88134.1 hypothetical protein WT68_20660 [Burkholderia stagnalis]